MFTGLSELPVRKSECTVERVCEHACITSLCSA